MGDMTVELTEDGLMEHFSINRHQAKALIRWIRAKRTRNLVHNDPSGEELFAAQHELKQSDNFPERDQRLAIMSEAEKLFV